MKKILSVLAALTLTASLLAGCSGKAANTPAETAGQAESASAAESTMESAAETETVSQQETTVAETEGSQPAEASGEETAVRVMALKGPTAMGMVQLMDTAEAGPVGGNAYELSLIHI